MEKLEKLIAEHKKLKLPGFPEDDSFAEWVEELIESDGYYIGLAISLVNKEKISVDYEHIERLRKDLPKFNVLSEEREIFDECTEYIESLGRIVTEMKND